MGDEYELSSKFVATFQYTSVRLEGNTFCLVMICTVNAGESITTLHYLLQLCLLTRFSQRSNAPWLSIILFLLSCGILRPFVFVPSFFHIIYCNLKRLSLSTNPIRLQLSDKSQMTRFSDSLCGPHFCRSSFLKTLQFSLRIPDALDFGDFRKYFYTLYVCK